MIQLLLLLAASALDANAHMALYYPPALKAENNPHTRGRADKAQHFPYGCCDVVAVRTVGYLIPS